ncbi:MAG TPA: Xaa-Pro peptidase family protein [Actinomycetota bacterium]
MADRFLERIRRAAGQAGEAGLDGLLATPGPDLRYLTGHAPPPLERLTLLVLHPDRDPVMLVPALERPAAVAAPGTSSVELAAWSDGEDPYAVAAGLLHPGRYAIADQTWASHVLGLVEAVPGCTFVPRGRHLPLLRARKDDDEIQLLSRAAAGADASFRAVKTHTFAGRREEEIAEDLAELLRAHGHQSVDFTIVASGPNAASPHHTAGERIMKLGDAVVLDFGGFASDYGSDITRTVVIGEPPEGFEEVYGVVRRAQQAAFEAVRPGAHPEEIDRAARAMIEDAGYGEHFIHRTGHGIGLETHEEPYIVAGNATPLEPGMTFSIEPGIYLAGRFGVRIEDIVAVTDGGAVRLNEATRELQVVR